MFTLEGLKDTDNPTEGKIEEELFNVTEFKAEFVILEEEGNGLIQAASGMENKKKLYVEAQLASGERFKVKNELSPAEAKKYFVAFLENKLLVSQNPEFERVLEVDFENIERGMKWQGLVLLLILMSIFTFSTRESGETLSNSIWTGLFVGGVMGGSWLFGAVAYNCIPKIIEKISYKIGMPSEVWRSAKSLQIKPLFKKDKRFSKIVFLNGVEFFLIILGIILMMFWLGISILGFQFLTDRAGFMVEFKNYF